MKSAFHLAITVEEVLHGNKDDDGTDEVEWAVTKSSHCLFVRHVGFAVDDFVVVASARMTCYLMEVSAIPCDGNAEFGRKRILLRSCHPVSEIGTVTTRRTFLSPTAVFLMDSK